MKWLEKFAIEVRDISDQEIQFLHKYAYVIDSRESRDALILVLEKEMERRKNKPTSYTEELKTESEET